MKIILDQPEICQAITDYVARLYGAKWCSVNLRFEDGKPPVELTAEWPFSAEVEIVESPQP